MKLMVEAGVEPWASSFEALRSNRRARYTYELDVLDEDPSYLTEYSDDSDAFFIHDGEAAYLNALMWYITGDERHAEKSIEIFNTYKGLRRNTTAIPLRSGRVWRMIEAAEIIAHTYDGWDPGEMQEFKDMLVYPGYSATTVPTQAINNDDFTFYWHVYQGDPGRHGNQGLFAMRTMMAMGIFLDNEVMYERSLRYLRGESHRSDDLPYPSGPPINNREITDCNFFDEYTINGFRDTIPDYGYNEVISNYIFENGQCQESSRDQAHCVAGVITINNMSEMAWNQGDDLYGHLDNRPLLGLEFTLRYNLSDVFDFPDQPDPWEPTTLSGEYIERRDRSGRWNAKKINPGVNCDQADITRGGDNFSPIYEMPLAHYKDRMLLPSDDYKWVQRGHDLYETMFGVETTGVVTDHPVYGGLAFRRVSPGDPVSGFDSNGVPQFAMNMLPGTIEAENFDHFAGDGQGRTYSDSTSGNRGNQYRFDSDVDVQLDAGAFYIGVTRAGEFITYTVNVPETREYTIRARTGSRKDIGDIRFSFDGVDRTGSVSVPNTGSFTNFETFTVAENVLLMKGVQQVKLEILNCAYTIDSFSVETNDGIGSGVVDMMVGGTNFTPEFVDVIDGDGMGDGNGVGYSLAGDHQLDTLPWTDIDTLYLQFSGDVSATLTNGSVLLTGTNGGDYNLGAISFDTDSNIATIPVIGGIGTDSLVLSIFEDTVSTSDGTAIGGSDGGQFDYFFNVLVGDEDASGQVNSSDAFAVFASNADAANESNFRRDIDGSGQINSSDAFAAFANNANGLPAPPTPPTAP